MIVTKYLAALIKGLGLVPVSTVSANKVPERFIFYQVVGANPLPSQTATASERVSVNISAIAPRRAEAEADLQQVLQALTDSYELDISHAGASPSYLEVTALPVLLPAVSAADLSKQAYQYTMTATLIFQT